jgi:hypothetical protein
MRHIAGELPAKSTASHALLAQPVLDLVTIKAAATPKGFTNSVSKIYLSPCLYADASHPRRASSGSYTTALLLLLLLLSRHLEKTSCLHAAIQIMLLYNLYFVTKK